MGKEINELILKSSIVLLIKGSTLNGINSVSIEDIPNLLEEIAVKYRE